MLDLATAIWVAGSAALFGLCYFYQWRFARALAARRTAERSAESPANDPGPMGFSLMQGSALLRRQTDPELESLRRKVWLSFAAFGVFALLGLPIIAALLP
jgi:hypothetical protein